MGHDYFGSQKYKMKYSKVSFNSKEFLKFSGWKLADSDSDKQKLWVHDSQGTRAAEYWVDAEK